MLQNNSFPPGVLAVIFDILHARQQLRVTNPHHEVIDLGDDRWHVSTSNDGDDVVINRLPSRNQVSFLEDRRRTLTEELGRHLPLSRIQWPPTDPDRDRKKKIKTAAFNEVARIQKIIADINIEIAAVAPAERYRFNIKALAEVSSWRCYDTSELFEVDVSGIMPEIADKILSEIDNGNIGPVEVNVVPAAVVEPPKVEAPKPPATANKNRPSRSRKR